MIQIVLKMYKMGKYYNCIPNDKTENNIPCHEANMNIPWPRFLKSKDWLQTISETKCLNIQNWRNNENTKNTWKNWV